MSQRNLGAVAVVTAFLALPIALASGHDMAAHFAFGEPGDAAKIDRTVPIAMNDMSFAPSALSVAAGETIRFTVNNTSTVDHEFSLGDEKSQAAHRHVMAMMKDGTTMHHHDANVVSVGAGQTKELIWHFTQAGQYEFDCNVPGHYEAGMKGLITVSPKV